MKGNLTYLSGLVDWVRDFYVDSFKFEFCINILSLSCQAYIRSAWDFIEWVYCIIYGLLHEELDMEFIQCISGYEFAYYVKKI